MTLPLELDDSHLVAASYHASWTGASRQSSPPFARGLVIRLKPPHVLDGLTDVGLRPRQSINTLAAGNRGMARHLLPAYRRRVGIAYHRDGPDNPWQGLRTMTAPPTLGEYLTVKRAA